MAPPGPLALAPEIDEFRTQFEQISAEADAIVTPLTDEQFTWRPAPEAWSIAECLEHLNVTARLYLPALDDGIAEAIRRGLYATGPFTYGWLGPLFVRFARPQSRFKARAPKIFEPARDRSRAEIVAAFRAYQVQFVDRLRQANGLNLARARVRSPAVSWLRIPLGSAFALMVAHERRHLWQARRVVDAAGFPATRVVQP